MDLRNLLCHKLGKCRIVFFVVLCFAMATLTGFTTANKNITVVADGNTKVVNTVYDNPKAILKQAGVSLKDSDEYIVSTDKVTDNSVITVNRSVPVTVEVNGKAQTVNTAKKTVGELLTSMNLDGDKYYTQEDKNTELQANSTIKVLNVSSRLVLKDEVQPYQVI